jgi:hypothetical protein
MSETLPVKRWGNMRDSRIELTDVEYMDVDRVYVTINKMFDLCIVKTDEGLVIDIFPTDNTIPFDESLGSTYVFDNEVTHIPE